MGVESVDTGDREFGDAGPGTVGTGLALGPVIFAGGTNTGGAPEEFTGGVANGGGMPGAPGPPGGIMPGGGGNPGGMGKPGGGGLEVGRGISE